MNDKEIIERLAEFMGWERCLCKDEYGWNKEVESFVRISDGREMYATQYDNSGFVLKRDTWNPLKDWNHWRQVEEKIMEDETLTQDYVDELDSGMSQYDGMFINVEYSIKDRCLALLTVLEDGNK